MTATLNTTKTLSLKFQPKQTVNEIHEIVEDFADWLVASQNEVTHYKPLFTPLPDSKLIVIEYTTSDETYMVDFITFANDLHVKENGNRYVEIKLAMEHHTEMFAHVKKATEWYNEE
ncbi:hypothetical protein ACFFHM_03205 [Halalkalibacter kiskunsagensis]|uniref:Phage protein n=1 Tax=Halalkalibacter kiskunsagensis TaxID=1548599 RepID=A0ABV6KBU4_9BACI